jgi:hypothetical protein
MITVLGLSFKQIRIIILLALLAAAAIYTQDQKLSTAYWYKTTKVLIYPINGDGSSETAIYIAQLKPNDYAAIDEFFNRSSVQYQLITSEPIKTQLETEIASIPPAPPESRNILSVMLWSLRLRYWAYQHTPESIESDHPIRLYVIYHQAKENLRLAHSLGLQKGLIGVIHAFADDRQTQQNAVVMAHEILHTVGASDKYNENNLPSFPAGFVDPEQSPLYPQRYAEIMAGRTPISQSKAEMPLSLKQVKVGEMTAREIQWITPN